MLDKLKIFDSHFHIIDKRFPLIVNNGYLPDSFTCQDYLKRTAAYQLYGGVVVSGSFQGLLHNYCAYKYYVKNILKMLIYYV